MRGAAWLLAACALLAPASGWTQTQPPAAPVEEDDNGDTPLPDPGSTGYAADRRAVTIVPLLDPAAPVASGRGVAVAASEIYTALGDAPPGLLRRYAQEPALLQALVDRLVGDRLLAAEARRQGLDRDPMVVAALERALVSRLRGLLLNGRVAGPEAVTDDDVRRWYDAHPERFHVPVRRRARAIFLTDHAEALRILHLALLRRGQRFRNDFRVLAGQHNVPEDLRATRGELHEVALRDWPYAVQLELPVRQALFAMHREGDVVPQAVEGTWEGAHGWFVLRFVAQRAAIERSLDDSREWVRHRIVLERRVAAEQAEIERLATDAQLVRVPIDRAVRLDLSPTGAGPQR